MRKIILLFMLLLSGTSIISAQTQEGTNSPVGKWKFEAPYAPEGYTSGIIEFSLAEDKYSTSISFTGSGYTIPGDNIKVEKDSVIFSVYVEGNEVTINLKADSSIKMTGKAVYFEGEIPLTLAKEIPKE